MEPTAMPKVIHLPNPPTLEDVGIGAPELGTVLEQLQSILAHSRATPRKEPVPSLPIGPDLHTLIALVAQKSRESDLTQLATLVSERNAIASERDALAKERDHAAAETAQKEAQIKSLEARLVDLEKKVELGSHRVLDLGQKLEAERQRNAEIRGQIDSALRARDEAFRQKELSIRARDAALKDLKESEGRGTIGGNRIQELQKRVEEFQHHLQETQRATEDGRRAAVEMQKQMTALRQARDAATGQILSQQQKIQNLQDDLEAAILERDEALEGLRNLGNGSSLVPNSAG